MRVRVRQEACQGHTMCNMVAPEVFRLSAEDGHAYADDDAVAPALEADVRLAIAGCPERAIEEL